MQSTFIQKRGEINCQLIPKLPQLIQVQPVQDEKMNYFNFIILIFFKNVLRKNEWILK